VCCPGAGEPTIMVYTTVIDIINQPTITEDITGKPKEDKNEIDRDEEDKIDRSTGVTEETPGSEFDKKGSPGLNQFRFNKLR